MIEVGNTLFAMDLRRQSLDLSLMVFFGTEHLFVMLYFCGYQTLSLLGRFVKFFFLLVDQCDRYLFDQVERTVDVRLRWFKRLIFNVQIQMQTRLLQLLSLLIELSNHAGLSLALGKRRSVVNSVILIGNRIHQSISLKLILHT